MLLSVGSGSDRTEPDQNKGINHRLNLDKTLDEIIKDVITLVMEEENMNQTKTANRLNISRSTLWKKLQD